MYERLGSFESQIKKVKTPLDDRNWWFFESRKDPYAPGEHKWVQMPDDVSMYLEKAYRQWLDGGRNMKNQMCLVSTKFLVNFGDMKQYFVLDSQ